MRSLGLLEAKITPNDWAIIVVVLHFVVVMVLQWLVVVVVVVMVGLLALVVDFREVMMTSPPDLAHCDPPLNPSHFIYLNFD